MEYRFLKARHPEHNEGLWAKCRAFYAGGEMLLGNTRLMAEVFPPHMVECSANHHFIYEERRKRAFYIPYAGEIIDAIVAALFGEKVNITFSPDSVDPYYAKFIEDTSPPRGRELSLNQLLKQQILTALLCKRAWTLIDLPTAPPDQPIATRADEEAAGLLNAYACPIDPEMVLDWEENEDGDLEWAMVLHRECRRSEIGMLRDVVREDYTVYHRDHWERYRLEYKEGQKITDGHDVPLLDDGDLSFGRVPLLRLELSDGMWAMGKILSIAIAHFNLRNALSWAEYKSLFPVPIAKVGDEDIGNPISEDTERFHNQAFGQGYIPTIGSKDEFMYVGPDSSPYKVCMEDLSNLRDEMHRVLHHMALSVDNSAAALQRSADSKQIDQSAAAVVLRALGQDVREHAEKVMECIIAGRGDTIEVEAEGMESYNEQSVEALVEQASTVDAIKIPSATFQRLWAYRLARRILGEDASEDDLRAIQAELEQNIANEEYAVMPPTPPGPIIDMSNAEDGEDEEDDEYDGDPNRIA